MIGRCSLLPYVIMRIGIVSDTHNDRNRVRRALEWLRLESITTLLHAGDVSNGQILRLFAGFDLWLARGNMDQDPLLFQVSHELFGAGHYRNSHTLSLNGATVALVHSADSNTARGWIAAGTFDYVVHGHTHRPRDERIGQTRIINPGSLAQPRGPFAPSFCTLDLTTGDLRRVEL
jgi:uncharacterized protein